MTEIVIGMICRLETEEDDVRLLGANCLLCANHLQDLDNLLDLDHLPWV